MAKGKDANDFAVEQGPGALRAYMDVSGPVPFDNEPDRFYPNGHRDERALIPRVIVPTPYKWQDPSTLQPRRWLYGKQYIRKFISSTVMSVRCGKSSLVLVEAIAMASGRNLLNVAFKERLRVWYWNGEDPQDEIDRRVAAILLHFKIAARDIEGWFFTDNGRDTPIRIAERQKDLVVFGP